MSNIGAGHSPPREPFADLSNREAKPLQDAVAAKEKRPLPTPTQSQARLQDSRQDENVPARAAHSQAQPAAFAARAAMQAPQGRLAGVKSEPLPTPSEKFVYHDAFYDIAGAHISPAQTPAQRQLCHDLHAVTRQPEGLKVYFYQNAQAELFAVSHGPQEHLRKTSTTHKEMQMGMIYAMNRGLGRFGHMQEAQRNAAKGMTMSMLRPSAKAKAADDASMHGGLRLCQNAAGEYSLDISPTFSFTDPLPAHADAIAQFYANVLLGAGQTPSRIGTVARPDDAQGQAISAALQRLAKKVEAFVAAQTDAAK